MFQPFVPEDVIQQVKQYNQPFYDSHEQFLPFMHEIEINQLKAYVCPLS
ncbi:hypothetical protein J4217_04135 [Candidatus Pacearchaeota archaeon]|nr:hypothetical protein [Candidatus Pacearchaeota archaeon]